MKKTLETHQKHITKTIEHTFETHKTNTLEKQQKNKLQKQLRNTL